MTTRVALRSGTGSTRPTRGAARWLALAASPTFALMAAISAFDAPPIPICSSATAMLPIDAMAWMYLLMSLFHLSPWLALASRRDPPAHPSHDKH